MSPKKFARYVYTIRHLRFKQILFRFYYASRCRPIKLKTIKALSLRKWQINDEWPAAVLSNLSQAGEFTALGETGNVHSKTIWHDATYSKLWLYNLHYLNELNSIGATLREDTLNQLIEQWIKENPPCKGIGWEPYPLSLRIVNLIKWYSREKKDIKAAWLISLAQQVRALNKQIEYHILGNHLFANGKALVFAGSYFDGPIASRWLRKGLRILDREIKEQFLNDGAHFELSPMYHACVLWDMCDLVNLANQSALPELIKRRSQWYKVIIRAFNWLSAMLHPDEGIAFFNDSAFGIAPEFSNIKSYLKQLGITITIKMNKFSAKWLKESGYCVVNINNNSKAIMDVGKIGPDYQPGHAHADTLSFELSLHGQRFLVNSGISQYGEGLLRLQQRGTKTHNTACINDLDSSEVWGGFRVARRAYPKNVLLRSEPGEIFVVGAHDGYTRLPGKPIHRREWNFKENYLRICDKVVGAFKEVEVRYYFHPNIVVKKLNNMQIECCFLGGQEAIMDITGATYLMIQETNWYPAFGSTIANKCLIVKMKGNELITQISW